MKNADRIRQYRDTITADPDLYDGDLDIIGWLINDTPERTWAPSEIGKVVGLDTSTVRNHLSELTEAVAIERRGNGAWSRYGSLVRRIA